MKSLQGHLLIASPKLRDPNFLKTVVLMVQHNEEGALGVVLNRPLEATIESTWEQVSESPCNSEGHLHQGGPCPGPLMVLHTDANKSQVEVLDGVHFTTDKEAIEELVLTASEPLKFVVNYSGWGPGQLEGELEAGGWFTAKATAEQVFRSDENFWPTVVRSAAREKLYPWLDPRLIPDDPSVN